MKCRYVAVVAAMSLCLGAAVARAQYYSYLSPEAGPTFRFGIGPSFFQNGQLTEFGTGVSSSVDYQTGLAVDAAFGWAFNQYVAADFETGFIGANINNVSGFSSDNSSLYNIPFLVNLTLSYPIPHTVLVPYVGAGVGGADVVFDTDSLSQNSTGYTVYGNEDDVVFAGQVFAGLRFKLNSNMALDVGYKYFATGDPTFSYPPSPYAPVNSNLSVGFDGVRTHSILFAFVWKF